MPRKPRANDYGALLWRRQIVVYTGVTACISQWTLGAVCGPGAAGGTLQMPHMAPDHPPGVTVLAADSLQAQRDGGRSIPSFFISP